MFEELSDSYIPKNVLHRGNQTNKLKTTFDNFRKFNTASNLLCQGGTGSGKTVCVNKIIQEESFNNNYIYVNAAYCKTSNEIFKKLFKLNYNTNRLLSEGIGILKANRKILVIDEVNKVKDLFSFFNDLNLIYRETNCPIILISNNRLLIDEMPEDARKTLFFDKVEFPPYNYIELENILLDRVTILKDKYNLSPINIEDIKRICALGTKDGSARSIFIIAFKCILANDFSEHRIEEILYSIKKEEWFEWVNRMNSLEKRFLSTLLDINKKTITPSDIFKLMEDLTPQRISQLITAFINYGVLEYTYISGGRGKGRYRLLRFAYSDLPDKLHRIALEHNIL